PAGRLRPGRRRAAGRLPDHPAAGRRGPGPGPGLRAPVPGGGALALGTALAALAAGTGFFLRQRRARSPLYDLHVAGWRIFWVAAVGGIIVFGALMGAIFVGQQDLQDVLGYSPLRAGVAIAPAAVCMVGFAP